MSVPAPEFPPLLSGHRLGADSNPFAHAVDGARASRLGAGDLVWADDADNLRFAVVLEPEVPAARCFGMLFTMMVAFGDAVGAISPPEMAITYQWPSVIQLNDGRIGAADMALPECRPDEVPDWLVVSLDICIRPVQAAADPGLDADRTTMWEEGCGDMPTLELLETVSRHLLAWIHTWGEDGYAPVQKSWMGRLSETAKAAPGIHPQGMEDAILIGIDEEGAGQFQYGDAIMSLPLASGLSAQKPRAGASA